MKTFIGNVEIWKKKRKEKQFCENQVKTSMLLLLWYRNNLLCKQQFTWKPADKLSELKNVFKG